VRACVRACVRAYRAVMSLDSRICDERAMGRVVEQLRRVMNPVSWANTYEWDAGQMR